MKTLSAASFAVMLAAAALSELPVGAADGSCEKLSALKLPNVTITMAQAVAAGQLRLPAAAGRGGAPAGAPIADPVQHPSSVLPRGGDADPHVRLGHQDGSLDARVWMERQDGGRRKRRLGGDDQLWGPGRGRPGRLRGDVH